ncbi:ABC transporter ATP-binding protein [Miniphocaeibacter halophilus]|uniref:ABC transporter ATP-binding protein n=1 Tax=Miniphocaeibacter halophilus TaxID=2931922 RepID=A0AC61MMQ6_9FIRM|nr:ABC transporter ATP-binding protein [Miniphocaeibacter halophilus]QQK06925.1 ABC transporter ATP-binding protein [Miniphocaeibacter halophilus]
MLKINNLYKSFQVGTEKYEVLKGITMKVEEGEFVGVMGASGSGKTTLLNCISAYIPIDSGEILLGETDISKLNNEDLAEIRNRDLGFVFQDFMLLDGLTIRENIMLPRIISERVDVSMEEMADSLCEIFEISHIKNKYPAEISGGEKQRTAVARALINNPKIILADEPTGNLDSKSSRAVIKSFIEAKNSLGATILMVTHDSLAASHCDRVVILKDGLVWDIKERKNEERRIFQKELLDSIQLLSEEG